MTFVFLPLRLKTSIYNSEEKQNLAKSFYIQHVEAASPENTNWPSQSHLEPKLRDAGTGPTSHAKTNQFRKPGFIDARNNKYFSNGKTQTKIRAAQMRLLPLGQTQGTRPGWYDNTMSLDKDVSLSSSAETDKVLDVVDSRKTMIVPELGEFPHPQATNQTVYPPYPRHRSTLATLIRQYWILLRVLLSEYRTSWFLQIFGGLLIPISFAFLIFSIGGVTSPEKAIYLLGGNMALSIATGPATFLILKIGWAQRSKEFHYWIALPIPKLLLVLAIVSIAQLFALPGLLGVYLFGNLLFGLPSSGTAWALIPLIPLGVLPLAGVGALLGLSARRGETANILSNSLIIFVGVLSPVTLPLEALPVPLRIISQFMPTTYVADAFRAVLGGQGTNLALDLVLLTLFSAVLLTTTYFRLDWRNT
jgi:ABC-2 type transport system permease protein